MSAPELIGFMRVRRRNLALGAALASFMFVGMHDAAASAAQLEPPVASHVASSQSLHVSGLAEAPSTDRDAIGISTYTPVQWPIDPTTKISSYFGLRSCAGCTRDHQGVDFNPGYGTPIAAIADGVVVAIGNPSGQLGVHAIVEHEVDGQLVRSVYAHMAMGSLAVGVGDEVLRGEILGLVGSTGQSTGPHLHFGILYGDQAIEPLSWMREHVTEAW
jgi:murein DD-endopeptidase MepM/ murein hydrolase activator NlpD